jgi:hypothetical protein
LIFFKGKIRGAASCSKGVVIIERKVYTIQLFHNEVGGRTVVKAILRKRREGI